MAILNLLQWIYVRILFGSMVYVNKQETASIAPEFSSWAVEQYKQLVEKKKVKWF